MHASFLALNKRIQCAHCADPYLDHQSASFIFFATISTMSSNTYPWTSTSQWCCQILSWCCLLDCIWIHMPPHDPCLSCLVMTQHSWWSKTRRSCVCVHVELSYSKCCFSCALNILGSSMLTIDDGKAFQSITALGKNEYLKVPLFGWSSKYDLLCDLLVGRVTGHSRFRTGLERWPSCALWKTASLAIFLLSASVLQLRSFNMVVTLLCLS